MIKFKKLLFWFLMIFSFMCPLAFAELDIIVNLSETYDDNITSVASNEQSDFLTEMALGVNYVKAYKASNLLLGAKIKENVYRKESAYTNNSQYLNLSYAHAFSEHFDFSVMDNFSHTYSLESFEDALGRDNGNYSRYDNSFSLEFSRVVSKKLRLGVVYTNGMYEVSRTGSTDSSLNSILISGMYYLDSSNILTFFYEGSRRDYTPGSSTTRHAFVSSFRKFFTPSFFADASVGFDFINSGKKDVLPQLSFSLTNEIDDVTSLSFSLRREQSSLVDNQAMYERWQTSLSFNRRLMDRLLGGVSMYYGTGEYTDSKIEDTLIGADFGLAYELKENMKVSFNYNLSTRDSNLVTREYDRNKVSLGFVMNF